MYGAEAGNLALKVLALGGVYVAGGIAVKILEKMKDGTFFNAFRDKWQYAEMMAKIPVSIVLNESAPLIGAAVRGLRSAQVAYCGRPRRVGSPRKRCGPLRFTQPFINLVNWHLRYAGLPAAILHTASPAGSLPEHGATLMSSGVTSQAIEIQNYFAGRA